MVWVLRVALCAVRFELRVKGSDKVVASSSEEGDEFSVSQDSHVCRALPIAAKAMKKGERAQLVIKPACALLSGSDSPSWGQK